MLHLGMGTGCILQFNLHDVTRADGSGADALLIGLQELKAPMVDALDRLACPKKRRVRKGCS